LITFFKAFEPDHDIVDEDIVPIFKFFDADMNLKISLKELIEVAKIKITVKPGHKQIHIGLTDIDGEMQVMWVSTP
jgi:Ca2+-binding EF-hand superfamily protein